jgi:hypothetical protein
MPYRIRTSERTVFRRCRRLWAWQSPSRFNRSVDEVVDHFWFGTGVHYALEDFHGWNKYGSPEVAFLAYVAATKATGKLPPTYLELTDMGVGLLQYYSTYWLRNRRPFKIFWVDGKPQVEVRFEIQLPILAPDGDSIVYHGTIDGVAEDDDGQLWIVEYKTAKLFRTYHFDVDDQITSYCWAAYCIYDRPIAGVIYLQFKKKLPQYPRILANGKISVDKGQGTTATMYRQAILDIYGEVKNAPPENVRFLNNLVIDETEDSDLFIRRDFIERNEYQIGAQGEKILLEAADMVNPDLPLYPNPSQQCGWQCPLQSVCVAMDDGSDFESLLGSLTVDREEEDRSWRNLLPPPDQIQKPQLQSSLPQGDLPTISEAMDLLEEWDLQR